MRLQENKLLSYFPNSEDLLGYFSIVELILVKPSSYQNLSDSEFTWLLIL